jgi:hypothetical protein
MTFQLSIVEKMSTMLRRPYLTSLAYVGCTLVFYFLVKNHQNPTALFLKTKYSFTNTLFWKNNSPKRDIKLFFWGGCHHTYAY